MYVRKELADILIPLYVYLCQAKTYRMRNINIIDETFACPVLTQATIVADLGCVVCGGLHIHNPQPKLTNTGFSLVLHS